MKSEVNFSDTLIDGIKIALMFSFVVGVFTLWNILIAFLATFSIAAILANVFAIILGLGWPLGFSESISMVICVGFGVSQVVHMSSNYM